MARKLIDIGAIGNDGTGDSIRESFRKVNENFRELYSSLGLGERLTFIGLDDSPTSYIGQEGAVVTVNDTTDGVRFKQIAGGIGVNIDTTTNPNEIRINSEFADIQGDTSPQLGGDLSAQSGGQQFRIQDLTTPITDDEAVNKAYADSKVSLAGVDAVDPETGVTNSAFGRMSGPLILSRNPVESDDITYNGLIAATKSYVDNAGFGSGSNLYVSQATGDDARDNISENLRGRSLATAYRTIEAALKRAEEIMLDSQRELGPYRKILTYNSGANTVTLEEVDTSPLSGSGFLGSVDLSIDTFEIANPGTNYVAGDTITVSGGTGTSATFVVLATASTPGAVTSLQQISSGSYTSLPGSTGVATTTDSEFGAGLTLNLTYRVNDVNIGAGGTGYSLVSVRVEGGGGTGAFGTATISGGVITEIEITDPGSGFTSLPTLTVDLPRFFLRTDNFRTDFTGDVTTDTIDAIRGRDIREGLFLEGVNSGAIAQILAHDGSLDSEGREIFDVDFISGNFEIGEPIAYGDRARVQQICVFVEAGIYEESFPLRVPPNVAIVGDEFRRTIVRPREGVTSSSPWAFIKFRRDPVIDGLTVATQPFGYHYLTDSTQPVYPKIDNPGDYTSAAELLRLNRRFLQAEVIAWINNQIETETAPFTSSFNYDSVRCSKDVGLITDAIIFDLKYGEYNRTISAGLKYFETASGRTAITTQLSETTAALERWLELAKDVINNVEITSVLNTSQVQVVDTAITVESGAETVVEDLNAALIDVIDNSGSVNYPKECDQLDVFLMNDTNIIRAVTAQGQGGFMMVLDPTGQILAKSPYCQESASFSKSIDAQTFAGGMFVDGFAGNLQFFHSASASNTRISVSGLERFPELPASFIVNDQVYRINYVRDFQYNPAGSTATFVLDETNPFLLTPGANTCTISVGSPAVITKSAHGLQSGATIRFTTTGTLPTGIEADKDYYVLGQNITANTFRVEETLGSGVAVTTTGAGSGTHSYQRLYEVLMPGNRSMLSNDFTQVNDMGYGLLTHNGGLTEAVSMFTYYCYTSYMCLGGGQIRSIGGSSAHGVYALVAEGADPLEVPTPTEPYYDFSQGVDAYAPSPSFATTAGDLAIWVTNTTHEPLPGSELEIDHGHEIVRYPVTGVDKEGLPANVYRLNLTADTTGNFDGLAASVSDGVKMTLRANGQLILTGGLEDVAVRPSTGLVLNEDPFVYRVLQFQAYTEDLDDDFPIQVTVADPGEFEVLQTVQTITGTDTATTGGALIPAGSFNNGAVYTIVSPGTTDFTLIGAADSNIGTTFKATGAGIGTGIAARYRSHTLKIGDTFTPTSSSNGFTSGTTYYVVDVPDANQFKVSTTPGGSVATLTNGTGLQIQGVIPHRLKEGFTVAFESTGTLPGNIDADPYVVLETGLTSTVFRVSKSRGGDAVEVTGSGTGVQTYFQTGLTLTTLRENYNYNDLTIYKPGLTVAGSTTTVSSFTIASPGVVNTSGAHGLNAGDVIKFESTGSLPTGINDQDHFFVFDPDPSSVGAGSTEFTLSGDHPSLYSGAPTEIDFTGSPTGTASFSLVQGRSGDDTLYVVPVSEGDEDRIPDSIFVFKGEEYIIDSYTKNVGENFAQITLNRDLEDSVLQFGGGYTIKSAVATRTVDAEATLTIRISLVRVTSHDLLDIGTGSYADTNYPNEIFGGPVNERSESNEVQERDVGRVFFVTTDQFGNFKVGPFFKVDQGTGTVTFSASIALSNLDGLGFKRGVPISEFSVDNSFIDNAVDSVPTENATRVYIERRLGKTHSGGTVADGLLIPPTNGGFMALDGSLTMKADMQLGDNKIANIADATFPQDAVNLRSLTVDNFQDFTITNSQSNDLLVLTGDGNAVQNAQVVGDLSFDIDSTANTIDAQLNAGVVNNVEVNANAAIEQSKLDMTLSSTRASAPTGSAAVKQAASGLASFDDAIFNATDGFISIDDNGIAKIKLAQVAAKSVLGNNASTTDDAADVLFTTVVDQGGSIKKTQYSTTGFLRRNNSGSSSLDSDYAIVESSAGSSSTLGASELIRRDSNGDFGGRVVDIQQLNIDTKEAIDTTTTASGGYIQHYTWGGSGGILLSDGSLASDKTNVYDNDLHTFRTQNGLNPAPITCSEVQCTSLTTGGSTTAGTVTGRWTLTGTSPNESRFEATYAADLAEYYEGDEEYDVGSVLVFGGDKEVTTDNKENNTKVAGVVSNTAAYVMYGACPGFKNLVALQGRVPCKVIGKIEKGDILVTASIHGVAQANNNAQAGTIIGKALENYDSDQVGTIEVAVGRT